MTKAHKMYVWILQLQKWILKKKKKKKAKQKYLIKMANAYKITKTTAN